LVICIATAKEASAKIQIVELFICKWWRYCVIH
jgi:hypothetical protein